MNTFTAHIYFSAHGMFSLLKYFFYSDLATSREKFAIRKISRDLYGNKFSNKI